MRDICEENKKRLQEVLDGFLTDPVFPAMGFSAAVIKERELAFEYCGGYRQYDAEDPEGCLPMQTTSRYRIDNYLRQTLVQANSRSRPFRAILFLP